MLPQQQKVEIVAATTRRTKSRVRKRLLGEKSRPIEVERRQCRHGGRLTVRKMEKPKEAPRWGRGDVREALRWLSVLRRHNLTWSGSPYQKMEAEERNTKC